jgi:hypothetical protein
LRSVLMATTVPFHDPLKEEKDKARGLEDEKKWKI